MSMSDWNSVVTAAGFGKGLRRAEKVTFLPEPGPRVRYYPLVSVDDHVVEPPDMFIGRMPKRLADRAPQVVEAEDGYQAWHFDGNVYPNVGFNAVAGRAYDEISLDPSRFDEMRPGCWDVHERVKDMDLNGVYASLNFPSLLPGFAGTKFANCSDQEVGLATLRAWNDWYLTEWVGAYPTRFIPCQVGWLNDVDVAAAEIRRNAERGYRAVSFCELPTAVGRPSLHTGYWDPFLRACAETDTIVCLHAVSSSTHLTTSPDCPPHVLPALFPVNSMLAAVDWLFSKAALRFPNLKIAFSEGGLGWVPGLMDRLDYVMRHHRYLDGEWAGIELSPSELLARNFYFCVLEDPSILRIRDRVGVDHIMFEVDYPHADSTWPDSQETVYRQVKDFPDGEIRKMTYENACALFRHPLPGPDW